ncbi:ATP-dependent 6-phosphofructokinase [Pseudodesulfovibrio portus]|uniref:ATP-dependent 6-phosphofructokinase n=1 Tax=Pseudodesulfovibrio portus TaxID=231439 RepID=A0ABN6RT40_9BACT|nr:ATP-dependent 6-phosphofructokinase [Pseudodesulfovibrio portus]BDQ34260.1 ATP-dependent 6-phosphofructokinase [Pseudodesulfovibrio portus]
MAKSKLDFETRIPRLGTPKIPSPLTHFRHVDESVPVTLMLTSGELNELDTDILKKKFEKGGPREKLYFDPSKTKCAIVTCGGLCPGINDVIRSIVNEANYHYGIRTVLGITNGLRGFIPDYGYDIKELTPESVSNIHQFGGTILSSSRGLQDPEVIADSLERLNVNILFVIGGDGAMRAARSIVDEVSRRKRKVSIIGIPKTIDNDINFITRSFGFDTAVEKAAEAIRCAHVEATGVDHGVGLVKLMGREAGFIATQASLAMQEVNFLLVPEQRFTLDGEGGLLNALERRLRERGHAVIVCAEGAGQDLLGGPLERDPSGNPKLGDICGHIITGLKDHCRKQDIEMNIKFIDPSYLIRSVPANAGDRVYCGFLGQNAVHAAMAGKTGMVVTRLKSSMVHLPLELVTTKRRTINVNSEFWFSAMESTGQMEYLK